MSKRKVIGYVVRTGMKPKKGQYVTFIDGVWDIGPKNASYVFGNVTHASNMAKSSVGRVVRIVAKAKPLLPISHEDEAIVDRLVAKATEKLATKRMVVEEPDPIAVCHSCARCGALPITELCFKCTQIVGLEDRITQARAEERERCARECDAEAKEWREAEGRNEGYLAASHCAEAIRSLGEGITPEVARVLFPDDDTAE